MRTTVYEELTVPATDLSAYVGWSLQGVMSADGVIRWGKLLEAEVIELPSIVYDRGFPTGPRPAVRISHERYVAGRNGLKGVTVPDGALLSTHTPVGPYMVTIGRSVEVIPA